MNDKRTILLAHNLLAAATSLARILDQSVEGRCIMVNFQFASELIRDVQITANATVEELMLLCEEKGN